MCNDEILYVHRINQCQQIGPIITTYIVIKIGFYGDSVYCQKNPFGHGDKNWWGALNWYRNMCET